MSNLLPKHSVVPLSTGDLITVRALTAFELFSYAKVLNDAKARLQEKEKEKQREKRKQRQKQKEEDASTRANETKEDEGSSTGEKEEGFHIASLLVDIIAAHPDDIAKLIGLSCTKNAEWAKSLGLPDMLTVLAELVTVNLAMQKKTSELLSRLMQRLTVQS